MIIILPHKHAISMCLLLFISYSYNVVSIYSEELRKKKFKKKKSILYILLLLLLFTRIHVDKY